MSLRVSLGNVIRHRSEFIAIDDFETYKRCRVQVNTKGIILRDKVKGIEIKTKRQQVCRSGEFLVAEIDAKMGGFGIVPPELEGAIVSSHYFLYEVDEAALDAKYLGFYIRTSDFLEQVQAQGSTNYAAIRPHDVLEYKIPLPPLEEQRRIVARIEALATKIEEARHLRIKSIESAKSISDSAISEIISSRSEKTWENQVLGDLIVDACYGTSEKTHDYKVGIPILRMGNIQEGHLVFHDLKYLNFEEGIKEKLLLKPGDLLVNRTNSAELVGKCAVFMGEGDYGFASYLIRLRLNPDKAHPEFFAWYINSWIGRSYMFNERKQTTGQANINLKKLCSMPVSYPSLDGQVSIAKYLNNLKSKIDEILKAQRKSLREVDFLLQSIVNKAFKGEL
jgi:type I restriction enzyme S subunit